MNLRKNLKSIKERFVDHFYCDCDCMKCNTSENAGHVPVEDEEMG